MDSSDDETITDFVSDSDSFGAVESNQHDGPSSSQFHSESDFPEACHGQNDVQIAPVSNQASSMHVSLGDLFYSVDDEKRVWWPYNYLVISGVIQGRRQTHPSEWTAQADVFFGWLSSVLTDAFNQFVVSWPMVESFFFDEASH